MLFVLNKRINESPSRERRREGRRGKKKGAHEKCGCEMHAWIEREHLKYILINFVFESILKVYFSLILPLHVPLPLVYSGSLVHFASLVSLRMQFHEADLF